MYNHKNQYRCTIIRGKSQTEMDDLLPAYAKIIDGICPCSAEDFEQFFNNGLKYYLPESQRVKKTLDNHRTEISGKLFGMYYEADNGCVYESERTLKYLEDNDQPAFFKDICYKMQFPNGSQKASTVLERIKANIRIRPNAFLMKLLLAAEDTGMELTIKEIGYYVLNSLDVLQGKAAPEEVLDAIKADRQAGIVRDIIVPGKESSYNWQHIKEQLNYLVLANLIRITNDKRVLLNPREMPTIQMFAFNWDKALLFDVYSYDMSTIEGRKNFQYEWDKYFGQLSNYADKFGTSASAIAWNPENNNYGIFVINGRKVEIINDRDEPTTTDSNTTELGNEGERLIFDYEKSRVKAFNKRLANRVLSLGQTKGLGYDIQSVIAEPGDDAEFSKYIEVKSTKRTTIPNINNPEWCDTLNLTKNEWVAAQQHGKYYSIFRVYFTGRGAFVVVMNNPADKCEKEKITVTPITYSLDFSPESIDDVILISGKDGGDADAEAQ